MTKLHEEFIRGSVSEIFQNLKDRPAIKGEITLLVKGYIKDKDVPLEIIRQEIKNNIELADNRISSIAKQIATKYGLPKNKVYEEALKIKGEKGLDSKFS